MNLSFSSSMADQQTIQKIELSQLDDKSNIPLIKRVGLALIDQFKLVDQRKEFVFGDHLISGDFFTKTTNPIMYNPKDKTIIFKKCGQKATEPDQPPVLFDDVECHDEIQTLYDFCLSILPNGTEINKFVVFSRETTVGDSMSFHIDDCQLIKRKVAPNDRLDHYYDVGNKNYVFYSGELLPKYTFLFYTSSQGIHFDGGSLRFADDTTFNPKMNSGIMFDSREAHEVLNVKPINGQAVRKVTLVKIY